MAKLAGCQLAQFYHGEPLPYPMWVEPKVDGLRGVCHADGGSVRFISRYGNLLHNAVRPAACIADMGFHGVIDGELFADGGGWNLVASICRTGKPHPDAGKVRFIAFDLLTEDAWQHGASFHTQAERRDMLEDLLSRMDLLDTRVLITPRFTVATPDEVIAQARRLVGLGFEGAVLKDPKAAYRRTRNAAWRKVKFPKEFVATVYGAEEGTGRCAGTLGALRIQSAEFNCKVGTGFTDAERDTLWQMYLHGTLSGTRVRVAAQVDANPVAKGKLRFPAFLGVAK